jgi:predicted small metal-binding protein
MLGAILIRKERYDREEGLAMKEFACKSLGNDCGWRYIAKTEELLADVAAVHLRDVHGVYAITPDMVGKIKNLFTVPSPKDAAAAADLVLKEYNCNMDPECTWRYIAQTEELIADGVALHAREAHGVKEFTPEMIAKVKKSTHEWAGESAVLKKTA